MLPEFGDIAARLADEPRSGRPATITAEQICTIIAIACEAPRDSGYEMTHWTQQCVADEAMRRGVVDSISQRSVGRFFKRSNIKAASDPLLADAEAGSGL